MLGHRDGDWRQLLDLMTRRLTIDHQLVLAEHMPTVALGRPVIDELIHRPSRQQRPSLAVMTALATRLAARRVLATPRRRSRRILARRLGRVARRTLDLALKLGDPPLLPRDALLQPLDLLVHPQQHGDHDLAALVVDRLRLRPLHTTRFDGPALCPPTH
jgi:hypothetical protein